MMNYIIDWSDAHLKPPIAVPGNSINVHSTDLELTADDTWNWGEGLDEDFLKLLDHFTSRGILPDTPTLGQLWFNGAFNGFCVWTTNTPAGS